MNTSSFPQLYGNSPPNPALHDIFRRHYASQSRSANPQATRKRRSMIALYQNSTKNQSMNDSDILSPVLMEHGYTLASLIGHGGFSIVYKVIQNDTKIEFAAKCISNDQSIENSGKIDTDKETAKDKLTLNIDFNTEDSKSRFLKKEQTGQIKTENNKANKIHAGSHADLTKAEIDSLKSLNHPNIIKLYDYFESPTHTILILQYCNGGTLDLLIKPGRGLSSRLVVPYMKTILETVRFCHSKNIAHRDIKPHNFFIDGYGRPILGDFGLSRFQASLYSRCTTFGGSALYRSPEIIQHLPHDPFKADIWSLGVLFFQMVSGCDPWPTKDSHAMKYSIINAEYFIPSNVSASVSNVIRLMLTLDPMKRPTADEILGHPLFTTAEDILNIREQQQTVKKGPLCSLVDFSERKTRIPAKVIERGERPRNYSKEPKIHFVRTTK
ncbi:hypothetical protein TRFO_11420 [Tritrichomonas foetus]|uniref:Protein kinase domain-containing protein n=1 Tax=Tritrichomonas foetus TaxID=1144522 RepID=A0A1J4J6Y7_9EUKA|nr:hypothetical protein TRFO_11420 [Tritrichomonas foetus]|eukprot:OHS93959.1 hypothetical protein TRFO_11420 [Tritrichomonas foetus]